jgi:23S rRNA (guanosine2251-2'-O)-methyltransferase
MPSEKLQKHQKTHSTRISSPDTSSSRLPTDLRTIRLHVVLDNIRSAYNVGSFFRTADGTGCAMLHICGMSPYPPNPKLEKTALGTLETVPWKYYRTTMEVVDSLKKHGIPIFAAELNQQSVDYRTITYPNPVALVFGHELHGVSDFVLDAVDKIVHIPMRGSKTSLNVATAGGILMYEAVRTTPGELTSPTTLPST